MFTERYFMERKLPVVLSKDQLEDYFSRYYNGDLEAKRKLIEHNLSLVLHVSKKYENSSYDDTDIIYRGIIGLNSAIEHFDINKNVDFGYYATICIRREILAFFEEENKKIKTDSIEDNFKEYQKMNNKIKLNYDNELNTFDIMNSSTSDVSSLYMCKAILSEIRHIVENLQMPLKEIICLYFGFYDRCYSQKEISEKLNISQPTVHRKIKEGLKQIEEELVSNGYIDRPRKK